MIKLTPAQAAAAGRSRHDVCVVGGPGSGKTTVLVHRFAMRIEQGSVPARLLMFAPTEEAAAMLRIAALRTLSDVHESAPAACTVEGFCAALLRRHAVQAGLDPSFRILDPAEAREELRAAVAGALELLCSAEGGGMRKLFGALDIAEPVEPFVSAYAAMRLTATAVTDYPAEDEHSLDSLFFAAESLAAAGDASPAVREWSARLLPLKGRAASEEHFRVLEAAPASFGAGLLEAARAVLAGEFYARERILLWRALDAADAAYRHRKQERRALDATDLCENAIRLLRDDVALRTRVRTAFDEILVDDFPDMTPLQLGVIDLIRRPGRLFATGAAGAAARPAAKIFGRYRRTLEESGFPIDRLDGLFRGPAELREGVRAVLEGTEEPAGTGTSPGTEFRLEVIAAAGPEAARLEAEHLASRIAQLLGTPVRDARSGTVRAAHAEDVLVFVPAEACLVRFEAALDRHGIAYSSTPGPGFWSRPEVACLVHLLRSVANPRDDLSLVAVLRSPLADVSDDALYRLADGGNLGASLTCLNHNSGHYSEQDAARLQRFGEMLASLRAQSGHSAPDLLLLRALTATGYERTLTASGRANVAALLEWLRRRHQRAPVPLPLLVRNLELQRSAGIDPFVSVPARPGVRLRILDGAPHEEAAPVVCVAALDQAAPGDPPPISFSPSSGLAARWIDPASGSPVADTAYAAFARHWQTEHRTAVDRLFAAALTRATERVILSFAGPQEESGESVARRLARFEPGMGPVRFTRVMSPPVSPKAPEPLAPGLPALPAEPPSGQHDRVAGAAGVSLFRSCPRRFYLGRELGWQSRRAPLDPGCYVDDGGIDDGELGREVRRLVRGEVIADASKHAQQMAARFRESELGRQAAAAIRREHDFEYLIPAGDILVEGRIDLWFDEGGKLVLAGLRTDPIQAEEAWIRSDEYAVEMRLHALALRHCTGSLPQRACLHFLRPDVVTPVSLDPDDLEDALAAVRELESAQNRGAFPVRQSSQCFRCGFYRGMCPVNT